MPNPHRNDIWFIKDKVVNFKLTSSSLRVGVNKIGKLVMTLAQLHNFCINERTSECLLQAEQEVSNFVPSTSQSADETPLEPTDEIQRLFSSQVPTNLRAYLQRVSSWLMK